MLQASFENLRFSGPLGMSMGMMKGFFMSSIVRMPEEALRDNVTKVVDMLNSTLSEESDNAAKTVSEASGGAVQPRPEHERYADTTLDKRTSVGTDGNW